jgi:hypothetical protein
MKVNDLACTALADPKGGCLMLGAGGYSVVGFNRQRDIAIKSELLVINLRSTSCGLSRWRTFSSFCCLVTSPKNSPDTVKSVPSSQSKAPTSPASYAFQPLRRPSPRFSTVAHPGHIQATAPTATLGLSRLRGRAVRRASHDLTESGAFSFVGHFPVRLWLVPPSNLLPGQLGNRGDPLAGAANSAGRTRNHHPCFLMPAPKPHDRRDRLLQGVEPEGISNCGDRAFVGQAFVGQSIHKRAAMAPVPARQVSGNQSRAARGNLPDQSRSREFKFPAAFEADLVGPALDGKHAAHLLMTAPEGKSKKPKQGFHACCTWQ